MSQAPGFEDFDKVCRVIDSCTNSRHNNVAYAMVQRYARKWPQNAILIAYLYDEVEGNLIDICTKACV